MSSRSPRRLRGSEGSTSRAWGVWPRLPHVAHGMRGATHPRTPLLFIKQPFPSALQRYGSVEGDTTGSDEDTPWCLHREAMASDALVLEGLVVRCIPWSLGGRGDL